MFAFGAVPLSQSFGIDPVVVPTPRGRISSRGSLVQSTSDDSDPAARFVTKTQKEQLDKFGATPETVGEIFFDKLTETPDFVVNLLPDRWRDVVHGFKEMKIEKQKRKERRSFRTDRKAMTYQGDDGQEGDPDNKLPHP